MIAARHWVRANIATFHGDPGEVTIAGQSAGSMAVNQLIASPMARGLFHRAIAESGLPTTRPATALAAAEQDGLAFAREKNMPSLAALRALPAEALQASKGSNSIRFVPVVDGAVLAEDPAAAMAGGRTAKVPMLAGFTADEGSALGKDYGSSDPGHLAELLRESFGSLADRFASLYPSGTPEERSAANILVRQDRGLAALDAWARARQAAGAPPLFAYRFNHVEPGPDSAKWRAFHSSEIPYVFGTLDAAPERAFTAADRALSEQLQGYWSNFVKTGDPNGEGLPLWPKFDAANPQILDIGARVAARPILPKAKLDLFRSIPAAEGRLSIF
jgi:para-nitrobenzyl esterase